MKEKKDRRADKFTEAHTKRLRSVAIFCIYDHPTDYPDHFVVRLWDGEEPTNTIVLANTLEEARAAIPQGLARFSRTEGDDPKIVETWI